MSPTWLPRSWVHRQMIGMRDEDLKRCAEAAYTAVWDLLFLQYGTIFTRQIAKVAESAVMALRTSTLPMGHAHDERYYTALRAVHDEDCPRRNPSCLKPLPSSCECKEEDGGG